MNCVHGVDMSEECQECTTANLSPADTVEMEAKVDVSTQDSALSHDRYLGDGVYASFDGYHIWLAANDYGNKVVALEPGVLAELLRYARRIWRIP